MMNEKQLKLFATAFTAIALLLIIVMVIDLDTKNRLLKAADSLKETINDGRIQAANNQRNSPDTDHDGAISPDLVANGNAPVAASAPNGRAPRPSRAGKGKVGPDSGNSGAGFPSVDE